MVKTKSLSYKYIECCRFTRNVKLTLNFNNIQRNEFSKDSGIAMITVIIFLVVMTVLGITMANTTIVENLISKNHRTSKEAFYHADAGIQNVLANINKEYSGKFVNLTQLCNEDFISGLASEKYSFENIEIKNDSCYFTSIGSCNQKISISKIESRFELKAHNIFDVGIVSDGDIEINGAPDMTGSIHANGNVIQTGKGMIKDTLDGRQFVSAHKNVSIQSDFYVLKVDQSGEPILDNKGNKIYEKIDNGSDRIIQNSSKMFIPKVTDDHFEYWKDSTAYRYEGDVTIEKNNQTQQYDIVNASKITLGSLNQIGGSSPSDPLIIFIDGDLVIDNKSRIGENTIIVAKGDITFRGESSFQLGEGDPVNTAIISGGNILFNGSGDAYGIFWCNGSFRRNGSNSVHGSIVAGDWIEDLDIEFNGAFEFNSFKDSSLPGMPLSPRITKWEDISLS